MSPFAYILRPLLPLLGVVAFASCTQHAVPPPAPPISTPVKLEVAPSTDAVREASKATASANAVVELQAKQLRDAKADVEQANRLAEEAFEQGLVAGSEQALLMKQVVESLQKRVTSLQLMNDAMFKDLAEASAAISDALAKLSELREQVGAARLALDVQTQAAEANRLAFTAQAKANSELTDQLAVQTDRKERWRLLALISSGLILVAVAIVIVKYYFFRISF